MRNITTVLILSLALTLPAFAQHKHGAKGPNGGPLEDVAGVHAELITAGNTITFYIVDEDSKPVSTSGYSGSVLIVSGSDRETVKLEPSGNNILKGDAKKAPAASAQVTILLKTKEGKSGQAKFKVGG